MAQTADHESLEQAGRRLEALEQECAGLHRELALQRASVERLRADLDLLSHGLFPRRSWPVLAIFIAAVLAGGVGGTVVWRSAQRSARLLPPPEAAAQLPHLLITSDPDGAEIVLDGVPRGSTPLLLTLPARSAEVRAALSAPGYGQLTVERRIEPERGVHIHARLAPTEPEIR